MGKYYLLVSFIFILLVALLWIYFKMSGLSKKKDNSLSHKERQLFMLYRNLDEMFISIEAYMDESKMIMVEERERAEKLLEETKRLLDPPLTEEIRIDPIPKKEISIPWPKEEFLSTKALDLELDKFNGKHERVITLDGKGMNIEQIAQELQISRGEVSLILGISKK